MKKRQWDHIDLNLVSPVVSDRLVTLYSEGPSELYSEDLVKAEASRHRSRKPYETLYSYGSEASNP